MFSVPQNYQRIGIDVVMGPVSTDLLIYLLHHSNFAKHLVDIVLCFAHAEIKFLVCTIHFSIQNADIPKEPNLATFTPHCANWIAPPPAVPIDCARPHFGLCL